MSSPFVWFQNNSKNTKSTLSFYQTLLGWNQAPQSPPGMTMFATESGPFAGVVDVENGNQGWLPYVSVEDVEAATAKAQTLGAEVLKEKTKGPAGEYTIVKDPGGAAVALWQKSN